METTTIQISKKLKMKLDKLGSKGDTYEDIIERLLDWSNISKTVGFKP